MGTTNHCIKELVFDPPPPTDSVSCHAWNADRSMLALSPNNETIHIYIDGGNGIWKLKKILEEHTFKVSGLDWSEVTNKLVSCGEDRNAFVWSVHIEKEEIVFKSEPVLLNLSNSATCVRWSPSGQKFALGSCSDSIFICYYDGESKLWASKVLKEPFSSSVLSVAWHPNEILLGCGCMDSHVIVVSAYIKDMDSK